MAHYAELDENNIVTQVFVGRDEDDLAEGVTDWEVYYARPGFTVKRTSYNTRSGVHYNPETGEPSEDQTKAFRGTYAGVGFHYSEELDIFYPPQPYPSWVLNAETASWEAPVDYPEDGNSYIWDESSTSWQPVENAPSAE